MQEDFIHYIWAHKKISKVSQLKTVAGEPICIHTTGQYNTNSGPDFFNAKLSIGDQLWAGNVEMHIKSSDWYVHHHETDSRYDNVILHVVWDYDAEIFRKDNTEIPTLQLKDYIDKDLLVAYQKLMHGNQKWINCESDFKAVDSFTLNHWLERLYIERLNRKADDINKILKQSANNWEAVLFKLLAKNFGLKVNGEAFFTMASTFEFSVLRKLQSNRIHLEALFFGQANLLNDSYEDIYFIELQKSYAFLKQKFKLSNRNVVPVQFFRLRPANFPTIRLSQLAMLYHKQQHVFSKIIEAKSIQDIYDLFTVETANYWESHYTFSKTVKSSKKRMTKAFIDLLIINTIIPLKFSYAKYKGHDVGHDLIDMIQQVSIEKNNIVKAFSALKLMPKTALQSQALLQLKQNYCDKNKCIQCAIGNRILTIESQSKK